MRCGQAKNCRQEGDHRCYNCGQLFCIVHYKTCARCLHEVCRDCHTLFHTYLSETKPYLAVCGEWPTTDGERRKLLLWNLKVNSRLTDLFIPYLRRAGFTFPKDKICVAITAQQRGDFHKFKWSIASDPNFVALLPLNENYDPSWIKDLVGRAEALEIVASGRWYFVHSSLIISDRNREGKKKSEQSIGVVLSGLSNTPFNKKKMQVSDSKNDDETKEMFATWASDKETRSKIYNIDAIVPLYNSELVISTRENFLKSGIENSIGRRMCDVLVSLLLPKINGRPALVLWGSRTGLHREYLSESVPVREFRHKTSKKLVRCLLAAAEGQKVRIVAGDPLSDVVADVDLTCMWERGKMRERFGVDHAFSRIEQEYVFYRLATVCESTLHVGMQSGNIEPLINNPRTNVICVNENTKGGAGLVNVEHITLKRDEKVRKGSLLPWNLYLPFNLPVLPSIVGELTRFMMEQYGESINMGVGIRNLAKDLGIEVDTTTVEKTIKTAGRELSSRSSETPRRPDMLRIERDGHLVEKLLVYLGAKLEGTLDPMKETSGSVDLRLEPHLLSLLVASSRPKVQYTISRLNNVMAQPVRTRREILLGFVVNFVTKHELYEKHKKHQQGLGALPVELEARAKVLIEAFRVEAEAADRSRDEVAILTSIVDGVFQENKKSVEMMSRTVKSALSSLDQRGTELCRQWNALRKNLRLEDADYKELKPVLKRLNEAVGKDLLEA